MVDEVDRGVLRQLVVQEDINKVARVPINIQGYGAAASQGIDGNRECREQNFQLHFL